MYAKIIHLGPLTFVKDLKKFTRTDHGCSYFPHVKKLNIHMVVKYSVSLKCGKYISLVVVFREIEIYFKLILT